MDKNEIRHHIDTPYTRSNRTWDNVKIIVSVDEEWSDWRSVQHTCWMTVNLLARMKGVVTSIDFDGMTKIPLLDNISPWQRAGSDSLDQSLRSMVDAIDYLKNGPSSKTIIINIGPGRSDSPSQLRAIGTGWVGGISNEIVEVATDDSCPVGPYIAACLATGEIFRRCGLETSVYSPPEPIFYSAWSHSTHRTLQEAPNALNPPSELFIDVALAGVGAVGSAFLHTLLCWPGIKGQITAADTEDIDDTNLNRYVLFTKSDIPKPKAIRAASFFKDSDLQVIPHNVLLESIDPIGSSTRLVSAVDTGESRIALMERFYPGRALYGATNELRSEVVRCGPPEIGACLACFQHPSSIVSDAELHQKLRGLPNEDLENMANELGLTMDDITGAKKRLRCGEVDSAILDYLREPSDGETAFSVGFVSVLSGTILAAELVKDFYAIDVPLNDSLQKTVFQFVRIDSLRNGATSYGRDPRCRKCSEQIANDIWNKRFKEFIPHRP